LRPWWQAFPAALAREKLTQLSWIEKLRQWSILLLQPGRSGTPRSVTPPASRWVDELCSSDRTPTELQALVELPSNLLAHHLEVLERAGLISRSRSSGDGRRRYVHLDRDVLSALHDKPRLAPESALFACTRSSARSHLAAALWRQLADAPATSAGTHPAERVDPGAVTAATRAGLDLTGARPGTSTRWRNGWRWW
jgi:DNA-binding transcriptional ArsR family regulator